MSLILKIVVAVIIYIMTFVVIIMLIALICVMLWWLIKACFISKYTPTKRTIYKNLGEEVKKK